MPPKKNLKLSVRAAEPLIFARPPIPSRALRGEGRIPFELFLKYTANHIFIKLILSTFAIAKVLQIEEKGENRAAGDFYLASYRLKLVFMNKAVKITLVLAAVAAVFYVFRAPIQQSVSEKIELQLADFELPLSPCRKPIAYSLGSFDAKFGLSQNDFLAAIAEAESVWERPMARELFIYKPDGDLKINLIYDYRQDATLKLQKLGIAVKDTKSSYETLKAQYEAMKASYATLKAEYEKRALEFEARQKNYNAEAESWNRQGGAPEGVYERLTAEKAALDREFSKIKALEAGLNAKVDDINAFVVVLNRLVQTLNLNVARYNEIGGAAGREFEEGTYRSGSGGEAVDIYQFDSRQKLVRVLAHELGHALGLEHLENPKAIMYRLNSGVNETATPDDVLALKKLCEEK